MARLLDEIRSAFASGASMPQVPNQPKATRALSMLLSDSDELVRQKACWHLGEIAAAFDASKLEQFIRRLMWRLNPESGDTPHGVPEAVGEIGARSPRFVLPFVPVLSQYFDDEKLLPGLLQALGRIYGGKGDLPAEYLDVITQSLAAMTPAIYGNAALALLRVGGPDAGRSLRAIEDDTRTITLFCDGEYSTIELRELPQHIAGRLNDFCFVSTETAN